MTEKQSYIFGMQLRVEDPLRVSEWLCKHLFFRREQQGKESVLINGTMRLLLGELGCAAEKRVLEHAIYGGIQHFALETHDIHAAVRYCKEKGMELQLNPEGGVLYNPKVYGTGMSYFNIMTDFGFTVEVSQKLHCAEKPGENIIYGLEHIGLLVPDIYKALEFYEGLGFHREFEVVANETDIHRILCCMVSAGGTTIEIYELDDVTDLRKPLKPARYTLLIACEGFPEDARQYMCKGPAGEQVILCQSTMYLEKYSQLT